MSFCAVLYGTELYYFCCDPENIVFKGADLLFQLRGASLSWFEAFREIINPAHVYKVDVTSFYQLH